MRLEIIKCIIFNYLYMYIIHFRIICIINIIHIIQINKSYLIYFLFIFWHKKSPQYITGDF